MVDSIDDADAAHMFSVRIDRDGEAYVFRVEPHTGSLEMIAIDSTPGIIAFVLADNPGAAAKSAWTKGEIEGQALAKLGGMKALLTKAEPQATESKPASPDPRNPELLTNCKHGYPRCQGCDDEAPLELLRLNPYLRHDRDNKPPTEQPAAFIWGVRYYLGMLEDDGDWSHELGHIQELCKEFDAAISERSAKAYPETRAEPQTRRWRDGDGPVKCFTCDNMVSEPSVCEECFDRNKPERRVPEPEAVRPPNAELREEPAEESQ